MVEQQHDSHHGFAPSAVMIMIMMMIMMMMIIRDAPDTDLAGYFTKKRKCLASNFKGQAAYLACYIRYSAGYQRY